MSESLSSLQPLVEVQDLSVRFGSFWAVKGVSFTVGRGEIFGFLGANGAGKTTTIRVICGLLQATSGRVVVDGEVFLPGHEERIKAKVGYMSQKFTLYQDLSVGENLDFAAALHNVSGETFRQRKQELFEMIQFDRSERDIVEDLPGGTKQQIALVASLIHDPPLVVLDEPTAGVSPFSRAKFWDLIRLLTDKGKTVFVTTHYMDEAENCHRVVFMRSGELIALGSPQQLKKETFQKPLYSLLPRQGLPETVIENLTNLCDMVEPYGQRYHIILKEGVLPEILEDEFVVERIEPSLEDVFIRRVEGDR